MTETRRAERLAAASVRAVAGNPRADVRGGRLLLADRPVPLAVPYLVSEVSLDASGGGPSPAELRGIADAMGLRVRHSDPNLHGRLRPEPVLERVVFDIAEQFRCEAVAVEHRDPALPQVAPNVAAAFDRWSDAALAARVGETGIGLLVFTVTHLLRARLLRRPAPAAVDDVIEVTRGHLARLVGHALVELPAAIDAQASYARPAREIARLVAELVDDASRAPAGAEVPDAVIAMSRLLAVDWDTVGELASGAGVDGAGGPAADGRGYRIYTTAHDAEVSGADLYPGPVLQRLRRELEALIAAQAVSRARLGLHLRRLFPGTRTDGWEGGAEEGRLDPARLAQIVADPTNRRVWREVRLRPAATGGVTFLVDTSGSMKVQRYESVAVLVDTLARALESEGIVTEVLGFTTGAWAGGRPAAAWRAAGSPPEPGRLNEVQHIVYKAAGQTWRQARSGLAAMIKTDHYREGIDGEAVAWAYERLLALPLEPQARRLLVVISDGVPTDAATAAANTPDVLGEHLRAVAHSIEASGRVELGAIGVDRQLDRFVTRSVGLDLTGTLTIGTYSVLDRLFGSR